MKSPHHRLYRRLLKEFPLNLPVGITNIVTERGTHENPTRFDAIRRAPQKKLLDRVHRASAITRRRRRSQLAWHAAKIAGRLEEDRRRLTCEALGEDKSSKDFTSEDFDKVLAAFRAISQPDSLNAQIRAMNP
jgi:hypothetical protein